ncbi:MAG: hypothetical protein JXB49_25395 [Bacteroidales bacterium]|nr:hypothetical protein [Bacteroidales bacterium]
MNRRSRTTAKYHSNFDEPYSKTLLQKFKEIEEIEFESRKDLVHEKLSSIAKSGSHGIVFAKLWEQFIAINMAKYDYNYLISCHNKFLVLLSKAGDHRINILSQIIVNIFNEKHFDFENCLIQSKTPLLKKIFML